MKTLKDISVKNKKVLVRVDYNVPLENGIVTSDLRIKASIPTLKYLISNGAKKIVLISHLGRPDGKKVPELSLAPVAKKLQEVVNDEGLKINVNFIDDVSGPDVEGAVKNLKSGDVLLLENLRFYKGEEDDSSDFADEIIDAVDPDLFVQDGFAVVHRAHASTDAITNDLPSVAGLLVEKEVTNLEKAILNPKKPVLVIIGGAKVADKQPLIDKFLKVADKIFVGGKIAGDGYLPPENIKDSDRAKIVVASDFNEKDGMKLDIGKNSIDEVCSYVYGSKTVIWNGVLGKVEDEPFDEGSRIVAEAIGKSDTTSISCGVNTAGYVENLQQKEPDLKYTLVSTGGGAALEFLCGNELPGLAALDSSEK